MFFSFFFAWWSYCCSEWLCRNKNAFAASLAAKLAAGPQPKAGFRKEQTVDVPDQTQANEEDRKEAAAAMGNIIKEAAEEGAKREGENK